MSMYCTATFGSLSASAPLACASRKFKEHIGTYEYATTDWQALATTVEVPVDGVTAVSVIWVQNSVCQWDYHRTAVECLQGMESRTAVSTGVTV